MKDEEHDVVSLELYRRQLEDANPNQWLLDQLGREAAAGARDLRRRCWRSGAVNKKEVCPVEGVLVSGPPHPHRGHDETATWMSRFAS